MKINVSKMARDAIVGKEMTIEQIMEVIGMDIQRRKLYDVVKSMVKSGTVKRRIVDERFVYTAGREPKRDGAPKTYAPGTEKAYSRKDVEAIMGLIPKGEIPMAVKVRAAVKLLPMQPVDIIYAIGCKRKSVTSLISYLAQEGSIARMPDGRYNTSVNHLAELTRTRAANVCVI